MNSPHLLHCTALLIASSLLCNFSSAEEPASSEQAGMAEMMKKAAELGTPGEAHKVLGELVGSWSAEVKVWMAPDAPPAVSNGKSEVAWILGKRFVEEKFSGEAMGKPFEGMGITGYNNLKEQYVHVWLDDMHTSIFTSTGETSDGGKTITFSGRADCPVTGDKDVPMKQVLRFIDADTHILEMYDSRREGAKTMQITYKRN